MKILIIEHKLKLDKNGSKTKRNLPKRQKDQSKNLDSTGKA